MSWWRTAAGVQRSEQPVRKLFIRIVTRRSQHSCKIIINQGERRASCQRHHRSENPHQQHTTDAQIEGKSLGAKDHPPLIESSQETNCQRDSFCMEGGTSLCEQRLLLPAGSDRANEEIRLLLIHPGGRDEGEAGDGRRGGGVFDLKVNLE